jgi:glycosyltransferase involved in cell wall biosynthesis
MVRESEFHNDIDVSIIIPTYNEEDSIQEVVSKIHNVFSKTRKQYEVIVVNDGSQDRTKERAIAGGARVIEHAYNIGNGGAIKTGIRAAFGKSMVFIDGDGQHNPDEILHLLDKLETYDMVVGARTRRSKTALHRDLANSIYNLFASYICNRRIPDLTSGFRAIRSDIAREFLPLLPNTFSYPTTITLAVARSGYQYTYHPIETAGRIGKSKINLIQDGTRFLIILFKVSTLFSPLKVFIPASFSVFALGFGYGLFKVFYIGSTYGPTSAMLMTISGVIFLIGLISEQVTQLRYDRSIQRPNISDK